MYFLTLPSWASIQPKITHCVQFEVSFHQYLPLGLPISFMLFTILHMKVMFVLQVTFANSIFWWCDMYDLRFHFRKSYFILWCYYNFWMVICTHILHNKNQKQLAMWIIVFSLYVNGYLLTFKHITSLIMIFITILKNLSWLFCLNSPLRQDSQQRKQAESYEQETYRSHNPRDHCTWRNVRFLQSLEKCRLRQCQAITLHLLY